MGYSLKDIRKDAGYRSAREYAEKSGMAVPTYSRYEQMPDKIPLKAAWALADAFDCSIDAIVGRAQPDAETVHGSVQKRYDELPPALQDQIDMYMDFVEGKGATLQKQDAASKKMIYLDQAQRYEQMFMRTAALDKKSSELILFGSDEDIREAFHDFVSDILEGRRKNDSKQFPEIWLSRVKAMFEDAADLHFDRRGGLTAENPKTAAKYKPIFAEAKSNHAGQRREKDEEVMNGIMEAYDSMHKPA